MTTVCAGPEQRTRLHFDVRKRVDGRSGGGSGANQDCVVSEASYGSKGPLLHYCHNSRYYLETTIFHGSVTSAIIPLFSPSRGPCFILHDQLSFILRRVKLYFEFYCGRVTFLLYFALVCGE